MRVYTAYPLESDAAALIDCAPLHAGLAFTGINVFEVGLAVFMGRLDVLVDRLLICGGELAQMNRSELKHMLKERLNPLH